MIHKPCYVSALLILLLAYPSVDGSLSEDLVKTLISVVNETTRYQALHPNSSLQVLTKVKQIKGNYKFTLGTRIDGDNILASTEDDSIYPQHLDLQATVKYQNDSSKRRVTQIEVITDQNTDSIDTFLAESGTNLADTAEVLLEANSTDRLSYTVTFYGF